MEPIDSSAGPAQDTSAANANPASEVRREASDPPTEERGEDWESPAFRRSAKATEGITDHAPASTAGPSTQEAKSQPARRGRPPAKAAPEAVTPPAAPLPPELVAFAEIAATLTRLTQDERSRALAWAAHKFHVDLNTAPPARPVAKPLTRATATSKAAVPKTAAARPVVTKAAPSKPAVKATAPKAVKTAAPKRGRPAGKAAAATPTANAVDSKGLIQFIARHKPKTDVERVVVLAGFLAKQGQVLIETRDITGANRSAGAQDFTNASATVAVSLKRAVLTRVGQKLRLSPSGHALLTELSGGGARGESGSKGKKAPRRKKK